MRNFARSELFLIFLAAHWKLFVEADLQVDKQEKRQMMLRSQTRTQQEFGEFVNLDLTMEQVIASNHVCFAPNIDKMKELAMGGRDAWHYQTPPKPYVNLGMPKVGSLSLHSFFKCGGYSSSHWFCDRNIGVKGNNCGLCFDKAIKLGEPPLQYCGGNEAFMQLDFTLRDMSGKHRSCVFPQHEYLEQIHEENPNATFILPLRDVEAWTQSVYNWGAAHNRDYVESIDEECPYEGLLGGVSASLEAGIKPTPVAADPASRLAQFWCNHVTRVREFVAQHPSHILIEYQLEDEALGEDLSNIFQITPACWTHTHDSKHIH